jgi:hypothetical protein
MCHLFCVGTVRVMCGGVPRLGRLVILEGCRLSFCFLFLISYFSLLDHRMFWRLVALNPIKDALGVFYLWVLFILCLLWGYIYNCTWTKSCWITTCAVKAVYTSKSILRKTTLIDLVNTILLCITLWTLFRRSTTSRARKTKVSNWNKKHVGCQNTFSHV